LKASIDLADREFSSVSTSVGVWRIFTLQIGQWGWIQVGKSLSSVRVALFRLSRLMMLIGPTIIILAVVGGFYLAKKSLEPVERITLLAEEISVEKLNKRLNLALPDDELGHLASTFDGMLERLEESVKKQRQFTSDAAHELRTPLAAIRSIVDVTLHRDRSSEEYVSALSRIQREIERLSGLIDDLLIITRLENTLPKREFAVFSVSALIWEVLETMMVLAKEKNIEIETDLQENVEIAGDRKHLSRAVFNLVDNAIKYTPENGKIRIVARLSESNERIEIIVEDNGIGFDYEVALNKPGHGLRNLQERAQAIGASIAWGASRFTSGTRLHISLPVRTD